VAEPFVDTDVAEAAFTFEISSVDVLIVRVISPAPDT